MARRSDRERKRLGKVDTKRGMSRTMKVQEERNLSGETRKGKNENNRRARREKNSLVPSSAK